MQALIAAALFAAVYLLVYYPGATWVGEWLSKKLLGPTGGEPDEGDKIKQGVQKSIRDSIPENSGMILRIMVRIASFYLLDYYPLTSSLCKKLMAKLAEE